MRNNEFCLELQVVSSDEKESFWVTFVHANTDAKERQIEWEELKGRKQFWGEKWIIGEDFNDIKYHGE